MKNQERRGVTPHTRSQNDRKRSPKNPNGKPYLEVHHIIQLAKGGPDTIKNAVALCPNCHANKTEDDRHKKKQRKIREKEQRERDPFRLGFGPSRQNKNNPFSLGLGSGPKRKRSKKKRDSIFDL